MKIVIDELKELSYQCLYDIAKRYEVPVSKNREELIQNIYKRYCDVKKYVSYTFIRQLGREGKDGRTFLALDHNNQEVAIKMFRKDKKSSSIEREAKLQIIASKYGLSPKVIEYNGDAKYIVMEKLDENLYDCFCSQNGQLTHEQQKEIIKLFKKLDECKVFHGDPNPLNFMKKDGQWYIIDFGFAKPINDKINMKYTKNPNMKYMSLGFLLQLRSVYPKCKLDYITKIVNLYNKGT